MNAATIRDGWIDGLVHLPGRNAGYRAGRITLRSAVRHETVGRNSRQIGLNGYFPFLLPKEDPAEQYGEWDSTHWHACEWNAWSFGLELERFPGEPMTANQVWWAAYIILAIQEHTGQALTLDWIDEPIASPTSGPAGYLNHGALLIRACDPHSDGWTFDEWQQILTAIGGAPPAGQEYEANMEAIYGTDPTDPNWAAPTTSLCYVVTSGGIICAEMRGAPLPPEFGGLPNHPDLGHWLNGDENTGRPNGRGRLLVRMVHPFVLAATKIAHDNALTKPVTADEVRALVAGSGGSGGAGGPTAAQLAAVDGALEALASVASGASDAIARANAARATLDAQF